MGNSRIAGLNTKRTVVVECRLHIRVPWDSICGPRLLLIKALCYFPTVKEIPVTSMKHERTTFTYVVANSLFEMASSLWLVSRC